MTEWASDPAPAACCLLQIILQIFFPFNTRSHRSAFSAEFCFFRLRLAFVPKTEKPQNLRFTRMLRKRFLFGSVCACGFLFKSAVVIENARIRLRLAFSTESEIHIIITQNSLNEGPTTYKPNETPSLHSIVISLRHERAHRVRRISFGLLAHTHYSSIEEMTPMLSSANFQFFECNWRTYLYLSPRTHSPKWQNESTRDNFASGD